MAEADPWIGRVIDGRYRIDSVVGRGGFGAVYRAHHLGLDRTVALKRIRGGDDDLVARFGREARLQARLRHPVCVMVHDFVEDAGARWLVQEFVEGRTLADVLHAEGTLGPADAVAIACRLLGGLAAAHALGIVHRDIKPANIMLTRRGGSDEDVRLLDFGIARTMTDDETCMTSPGVIVGTPRYISPEQARGEPPAPTNDLYAVGVVLYHMLVGEPPFRARAMRDAVVAHLTLEPPPLPPVIPSAIAKVVEAALAKTPAARPPCAEAMVDRLRAALRSVDAPSAPLPRPERAGPPATTLIAPGAPDGSDPLGVAPAARRGRRPLVGLGAVVLTGAVLAGWYALSRDEGREGSGAPPIAPVEVATVEPRGLIGAPGEPPVYGGPPADVAGPAAVLDAHPDAHPDAHLDAGLTLDARSSDVPVPDAPEPARRDEPRTAPPRVSTSTLRRRLAASFTACACKRAAGLLAELARRDVNVEAERQRYTVECELFMSDGCRSPTMIDASHQ